MATIDATIIKALVEHIGMNPDDVPTDGSSDTIDISKYQEYPSDSVQISSDQCIIDRSKITPKVGDIMYFPNVPDVGEIIAFIVRIETNRIIFKFKRGDYGEDFTFVKSDSNPYQYILSDVISEWGSPKFYTTGIKVNNSAFLESYLSDIERRLYNVIINVERLQSQ